MSTKLIIERTKRTPFVEFDVEKGNLEIKGSILPENSVTFFKELLTWVDNYIKNPKQSTQIVLFIEYYNTSASKLLLQLIQKFEILVSMGKSVSLIWLYENDDIDMKDAGITYQSSIKIPTVIQSIEG